MCEETITAGISHQASPLIPIPTATLVTPHIGLAGVLFMDVSGFTKLSETLQKMGVLGIEALTVYVVDAVYRHSSPT